MNATVCLDAENCHIRKIHADEYTPIMVLNATGAIGVLESVSAEFGRSRYSIVLVSEYARLVQQEGAVSFVKDGTSSPCEAGADFLQLLKSFADQHAAHDIPNSIGIPFPAGGIGYLSFDYAKYCDAFRFAPQGNALAQPEALFVLPRVFIVFDHVQEMLYVAALSYRGAGRSPGASGARADKPLAQYVEETLGNIARTKDAHQKNKTDDAEPAAGALVANPQDKEQYMAMVSRIQERIVDGYLLQAVPSRRVAVKSALSPLAAYRLLRQHNPSPYLFYLNFGDHSLLGSSPESHVKSMRGDVVVTPIAGTRRRGQSAAEDKALAEELAADPKERAEHLMLVDLARNDISRVCTPESVAVKKSFEIKYFARVMHIVSEVAGKLAPGKNGLDALRMTFPAGTVSGAPKIQAVYEISLIEKERRGFYAGVVGYVEPGGDLDTCITLRSMLYKDGVFYAQVGAGVVFDSRPEREFEETQEKISALLRAMGVSS